MKRKKTQVSLENLKQDTERQEQDLPKLAAAVTNSEICDEDLKQMLARFGIREADMTVGTLIAMEVFRCATRGNLRALRKFEEWLDRSKEE